MILLIDNYDSFTYNLYQLLAEVEATKVVCNDVLSVDELLAQKPRAIVISPGPGGPEAAGVSMDLVRHNRSIPLLGVCLGMQCVGQAFGARIRGADRILHGKRAQVVHNGTGLFRGLPKEFGVGRYHSLVVDNLPSELVVDAWSPTGEVMALHHVDRPCWGVQFHPESILSDFGSQLVRNFLAL